MNSSIKSSSRKEKKPSASGTFVLRLNPELHAVLRQEAAAAETSLNDWCSRLLAAPGGAGVAGATEILVALRHRFGDDLLGVVAYGSFVRGEMATGSDVDLLVVLADRVKITRGLYHGWERVGPTWEGREVDLHYVHLPAAGDPVSGSWAEVAVCGILLWERGLMVSRRLISIRSRIARGELIRRQAQGQPYWVHEERDAKS
ncbi:MAG: toxin-antitoxin system HicB family antitoxin [Planctomycetota bacterium]|jgi:predicted nucleotidyltransferase|nr:toxin-antitoxin system HicB family antitoxin [Planctomycetota bacterium]